MTVTQALRCLALAAATAFATAPAAAQATNDTLAPPRSTAPAAWVDLGLGPGQIAGDVGTITLALGYARETQPGRVVLGRLLYSEEFCILGCYGPAAERLTELGLLYGFSSRSRWVAGLLAAGGSLVVGRRYDGDGNASTTGETERRVATVGVPVEAQVFLTPFPAVAIGATAHLDVNLQAPMIAGTVGFRLGRLMPERR